MKTSGIMVLLALAAGAGKAQNTRLPWYAFSSGFAAPASLSNVTTSVVGQPLIGTAQGGNARVVGGFLADTSLHGTTNGVSAAPPLPQVFALEQNYPNPFNPATVIRYALPVRTHVTLAVYDILGRLVAMLVDEDQAPGQHASVFDAGKTRAWAIASGVYFYTLRTSGFVQTRRLMVLR